MRRVRGFQLAFLMVFAVGCDREPASTGDRAAATSAPAAAAAPSVTAASRALDPDLEALKSVVPMNACAALTPEKLKRVFPELSFEVHQKLEPRMSGYVWDSRCTYYAGVGTHEFAKDVPTHTVEIFAATSATEAKARANLASRRENATTSTGFRLEPSLGEDAYVVTSTGVAMLFFAKGASEIQINVSELKTTNDEKIKKAVALAGTL